jgi:hypothetical protein
LTALGFRRLIELDRNAYDPSCLVEWRDTPASLFSKEIRMRSGKCPKCSSSEVFRCPEQGLQAHTYGVEILHLRGWAGKTSGLEGYLCARCGFMELYASLADPNFAPLEQDSNWQKVPQQGIGDAPAGPTTMI